MKSFPLFRATLVALFCLSSVGLAHAQQEPELTFTVETVTGPGRITPTLKWSTTQPGGLCTAAGDWTGAQEGSGELTLEPVTGARVWTLSCEWTDSVARLSWVPPTQYADGSPFNNPGSVIIWYGRSADALTETKTVAQKSPPLTTYEISGLATGKWFFQLAVVSDSGAQGIGSNIASKTIGGKVTRTVTVTLNPPKAAELTVQ